MVNKSHHVVSENDEVNGVLIISDQPPKISNDNSRVLFKYPSKAFNVDSFKTFRNAVIAIHSESEEQKFLTKVMTREAFFRLIHLVIVTMRPPEKIFEFLTSQFPRHLTIAQINGSDTLLYNRLCNRLNKVSSFQDIFNKPSDLDCITKGQDLRIAAFHYPPAIFETKSAFDEASKFSGIEVNVASTIGESIGMRPVVNNPTSEEKWSGVTKDIRSEKADVGLGQYYTYSLYLADPGQLPFYDIDGTCFLLKRPPLVHNWTGLILPFQWFCWIWIGISLIAGSITLIVWKFRRPQDGIIIGTAVMNLFANMTGVGTSTNTK